MKKLWIIFFGLILPFVMVSCGQVKDKKDIELMGAGDRMHDTFTFANLGVEINEKENNVYEISGSIERLEDKNIKEEFKIEDDVNHVVALKISANGKDVDSEKVKIEIDGVRSYDAEHLNGRNYTFVILEAVKGSSVSISVSWNGKDENKYIVTFDNNLILK